MYVDGEFSLYEKVVDATSETRINMKIDCKRIEVGFAIGATNLPKDRSDTDALFAVITKHKTYVFLAPSASECRYTYLSFASFLERDFSGNNFLFVSQRSCNI